MSDCKLGYWAVLLHADTWGDDAKKLAKVKENGGYLTTELATLIARQYKFARTFHGVGTHGYGPIADAVNAVQVDGALSLRQRVQDATKVVEAIQKKGYSRNPSGVTKMLWFRNPNDWYMYDTQAANAVGAGLSSVQGMRGFFGILRACDVDGLNKGIASLVAEAGFDLRSERIIDKFLWLRGSEIDKPVAKLKAREANLFAGNPALRDLAVAVQEILPNNRFDLLQDSI